MTSRISFAREFLDFKRLSAATSDRFRLRWKDRYPCLKDNTGSTGFDRHYIYHTAWAARILADTKPSAHVDISSTLYFCGIVSAFLPVKFYDHRPADLQLSGLTSESADLTALPFARNSIDSLSCMHVVEHIGLGRYGDALDPTGDLKAAAELQRVLAPGGNLLFVVPTGKPKIAFNAHRIYAYDQVTSYFPDLELKQFALIPDDPRDGGLIYDATKRQADSQTYGCGCFWFQKR
jgi:SAM-dependent methyltransferase